tara:strand:- start:520 stop:810 length:291 start_codon:yes stop_codon:yes gene_type:complete
MKVDDLSDEEREVFLKMSSQGLQMLKDQLMTLGLQSEDWKESDDIQMFKIQSYLTGAIIASVEFIAALPQNSRQDVIEHMSHITKLALQDITTQIH